jgi:uncharacterized protein (TIGR02246 family)
MLAEHPLDAVQRVDEAFNRGDLEGLLELYEDDAVMVYRPGAILRGKAELRDSFRTLLSLKTTARQEKFLVLEAGDLAMVTSRWTIKGITPDGKVIARGGCGSTTLRRQAGGGWRVAIANSWGEAVLD